MCLLFIYPSKMHSIETLLQMAESAARDGIAMFDWQRGRTLENSYANRNFRWTGRDYSGQSAQPLSLKTTNYSARDIKSEFLSELEWVVWYTQSIKPENDRRKNQKIARKMLWQIKRILGDELYLSYHRSAFGFAVWQTSEGLMMQERNERFPEMISDSDCFEIIQKIRQQLSHHLSKKEQVFLESLSADIS